MVRDDEKINPRAHCLDLFLDLSEIVIPQRIEGCHAWVIIAGDLFRRLNSGSELQQPNTDSTPFENSGRPCCFPVLAGAAMRDCRPVKRPDSIERCLRAEHHVIRTTYSIKTGKFQSQYR